MYASGFLAFTVALIGTMIIQRLARRWGLLAKPRADRWHQQPIALHGGLGFYPAFVFGAGFLLAWSMEVPRQEGISISSIPLDIKLGGALLIGSSLMFGIGLYDDLYDVRPVSKLVGQLFGASCFVLAGGVFSLTGNYVLNLVITYIWFVGITNAVNMLDNMDGLASGVTIILSIALAFLNWQGSEVHDGGALGVSMSVTLAAALGGFWFFNRAPASIFMGDSGSLSIGYLVAGLAVPGPLNGYFGLAGSENREIGIVGLAIPALVLLVPIYDTTLVTLTRMWRAQPVSQGGCDHASHRLVRLGLSEYDAVLILYGLSAAGCAMALVVQHYPLHSIPLLAVFAIAIMMSGIYLGRAQLLDLQPPRFGE
jgi:UDP-GlcNAc:undecaprenyl-phosphate GlcNAc-1-phosphate transferase